MDNQHKLIKGYRDLSEDEIHSINQVKLIGEELGKVLTSLRKLKDADQRWLSIAETHLQQGIMAAVRAVARPTTF